MKFSIFWITLYILLSFSCVSKSQEKEAENPFRTTPDTTSNTLTLLFAGDLMQHQGQIDTAYNGTSYNYDACFELVKQQIADADIAIGNLEVTLGGKPYAGYPTFSAPDEYLDAIRKAGFDVLLTANNHCLDKGKKGLERTISQLDSTGMWHLGTYRNGKERGENHPLIIEKNNIRIAFLNYTYGTNGIPVTPPNIVNYIDTIQIKSDLTKIHSAQPDVIIACMHWGQEYQNLPDKNQKVLAEWLFRHGVDHIIGAHPHVVQPIEVQANPENGEKHLLAYSLGNFISNMSKRGTDGGLILTLTLEKKSAITKLKDCSYSLVWTGRPVLTGQKNYVLYPADTLGTNLNSTSQQRMNVFLNDSRKLFKAHNRNIFEKIYQKTD